MTKKQAKNLRRTAAVLIVLAAAALIFIQCWSWSLAGPEDTVEVYRVMRVTTGNGEDDFQEVPLTDETKRAVEELLRTQRCRGLMEIGRASCRERV